MRARLNVSAVSYLNTVPFVYGLRQPMVCDSINLSLDYPAECANRLRNGNADLGLVPAAILNDSKDYRIIGDFCIGANGKVRTVALFSNSPLEKIERIYLDFESRTSVLLVKVLANEFWNKSFEWVSTNPSFSHRNLLNNEGFVAIGDKVFGLEGEFKFIYDLSEEWKRMTGLPFVFAVWVANKTIGKQFTLLFNKALEHGVLHIPEALKESSWQGLLYNESLRYLTNNISYSLNNDKLTALKLFLKLGKKVAPG